MELGIMLQSLEFGDLCIYLSAMELPKLVELNSEVKQVLTNIILVQQNAILYILFQAKFHLFSDEDNLYIPLDDEVYLMAFLRSCKYYPDSAFTRVNIITFCFHCCKYCPDSAFTTVIIIQTVLLRKMIFTQCLTRVNISNEYILLLSRQCFYQGR